MKFLQQTLPPPQKPLICRLPSFLFWITTLSPILWKACSQQPELQFWQPRQEQLDRHQEASSQSSSYLFGDAGDDEITPRTPFADAFHYSGVRNVVYDHVLGGDSSELASPR